MSLFLLYRQNMDRAASATRASPEQTPMAILAPVDRPLPDVADPPAPADPRRVDDGDSELVAFGWLDVTRPVSAPVCDAVRAPKDSRWESELRAVTVD